MITVPLEDVIHDVKSGYASGERSLSGIVQVRMNNVSTDGHLSLDEHIRVPATVKQLSAFQLRPGDVLFNSTNSPELVGKSATFKGYGEAVVFSNHFLRLRPDEARLLPEYLASWLMYQWQHRTFEKLCTQWVNQAAVRREDLLALPINLPSIPEQKRFAALLDKADHLRRSSRCAQQLNDSILQSVFLEMFGNPVTNPYRWDVVEVGHVFDIQLGKMLDAKRVTGQHSYPYLGNSNVQWGRLNLTTVKKMDFKDDFEKYRLKKGDLLVCEEGEVGRTAIWNGEIDTCCYQKALHRLRKKNDDVEEIFFLNYMRVAVLKGHIARQTSTATIAHFTAERFKELKMILPPRERQAKFSDIARKIDRLRVQQREANRQSEHLFQTLLHHAFSATGSSELDLSHV